jgi:hypothetical protein
VAYQGRIIKVKVKVKVKLFLGSECSRRLRLPEFQTVG